MGVKENVPYVKLVPVTSPAAGSEFTVQPSGAEWYRVIAMRFRFVTSAVVANRVVSLHADDQTSVFFHATPNSAQTAAQTIDYGSFPGASLGGVAGASLHIPLPYGGLWLPPGNRLFSQTAAIDVGDQYSLIVAQVEAFPNGPNYEWVPTVPRAIYERS